MANFTQDRMYEMLGDIVKSSKKKNNANTSFQNNYEPVTPEEWGKEIKAIESIVGNPNKWSLADYNMLQAKLNAYKKWRETTPEGKAVVDYHNEEGEYDIPLPAHLKDYTSGMMKSKLAYANEFGNPVEQIQFENPDEAEYFAGHYQDVAPAFMKKDGGELGNEKITLLNKFFR